MFLHPVGVLTPDNPGCSRVGATRHTRLSRPQPSAGTSISSMLRTRSTRRLPGHPAGMWRSRQHRYGDDQGDVASLNNAGDVILNVQHRKAGYPIDRGHAAVRAGRVGASVRLVDPTYDLAIHR